MKTDSDEERKERVCNVCLEQLTVIAEWSLRMSRQVKGNLETPEDKENCNFLLTDFSFPNTTDNPNYKHTMQITCIWVREIARMRMFAQNSFYVLLTFGKTWTTETDVHYTSTADSEWEFDDTNTAMRLTVTTEQLMNKEMLVIKIMKQSRIKNNNKFIGSADISFTDLLSLQEGGFLHESNVLFSNQATKVGSITLSAKLVKKVPVKWMNKNNAKESSSEESSHHAVLLSPAVEETTTVSYATLALNCIDICVDSPLVDEQVYGDVATDTIMAPHSRPPDDTDAALDDSHSILGVNSDPLKSVFANNVANQPVSTIEVDPNIPLEVSIYIFFHLFRL